MGIEAIVGGLISLAVILIPAWLSWRKQKHEPLQEHRDREQEISTDIASGDPAANSAHLDDQLAELERLSIGQGDQRGSGADAGASGAKPPSAG